MVLSAARLAPKVLAVACGVAATAGCSSASSAGSGPGGDAGTCHAYVVPSGTDLTPPTSFSGDVAPIFAKSCAISSTCHGSPTGTNNGVALGVAGMSTDAGTIRAGLVGQASREAPSMPYVTAGEPGRSYLMHKMDGDQCTLQTQCTGAPPGLPSPSPPSCQNSMPSGSPLLDVASRDTVRRWITQGALDD